MSYGVKVGQMRRLALKGFSAQCQSSGTSRGELMIRTLAIWIFGLLASAIIGGFIGSILDTSRYGGVGLPFGVIAGVCVFACLRLSPVPGADTTRI